MEVITAIGNWEKNKINKPLRKGTIDCIILSGGFSKRLWPLTLDFSKHLLPVGGRPVLSHVLDFVQESSIVRNIFLLTNPKFEKQTKDFYKKYIGNKSRSNIKVLVEPLGVPGGKLGPVGALDYAIAKLDLNPLLVIAGDNLFGFKLDEFLKFALTNGKSSNAIYRLQSKENTTEFGVAKLGKNGQIIDFKEKINMSAYKDISTACYFFQGNDIKLISKYLRSGGPSDSLGSLIHWLVQDGSQIVGFNFSSFWFDIGTRDKLLQANGIFLIDKRSGQIDRDSSIYGPVQIESDASISSSTIGPKVYIGPEVQIEDSEIENSIIMTGSVIRHGNIKNSIVGQKSKIEGNFSDSVCGPNSFIMN